MKKMIITLAVAAFAVAANAGGTACADKAAADGKAACSAKTACCATGAKTACCAKDGAKTVSIKKLKSPKDESQS